MRRPEVLKRLKRRRDFLKLRIIGVSPDVLSYDRAERGALTAAISHIENCDKWEEVRSKNGIRTDTPGHPL